MHLCINGSHEHVTKLHVGCVYIQSPHPKSALAYTNASYNCSQRAPQSVIHVQILKLNNALYCGHPHVTILMWRACCCCCRKLCVQIFRNLTSPLRPEHAKTPGYTLTLHKSHYVCPSYAKKRCFWARKLTCGNTYLQTFFEIGTQSAYTPAI